MAEDALFSHLESLRGDVPWGDVLDAGTGWSSLQWLTEVPTRSLTAVTACPRRRDALTARFAAGLRDVDEVLVGNWVDQEFLQGRAYDVVLADYLVGAVDRFAPYFQSRLLERLKRHLRADGILYLVGLEPYGDAGGSVEGALVTRIANLRDACLLHAQDRPHREYPRWWIVEELERRGYRVLSSRSFPIRYGESFVNAELDVCREALSRVGKTLARALAAEEQELRTEALRQIKRNGPLQWGFDYVISAELPASTQRKADV